MINDQLGNPVEPTIKDNKDGTYKVQYAAPTPLKHNIAVTFGDVSIPESPFKVKKKKI